MRNKKITRTTRLSRVPDTGTRAVTQEEIAARAHAIWLEQGCPDGRDVENWLQAERELGGGTAAAPVVDDDSEDVRQDSDGMMRTRLQDRLDDIDTDQGRRSATSVDV